MLGRMPECSGHMDVQELPGQDGGSAAWSPTLCEISAA